LALLAAALALISSSTPGGSWNVELAAGGLWVVVGVAWLVSALLSQLPGRRATHGLLGWLIVPAIALVTFGLIGTSLPLRLRFEASRSGFEALVANPAGAHAGVAAGLYRVSYAEPTSFGYRFAVEDGIGTEQGFAYSPNGPPPGPDIDTVAHEGDEGYRHLDGPWYIYVFKYF
jgi:hypothetical protein